MTQPVSLSEAKAQLAGLVHAAEGGEVVHISRHGKPVAVLLSEQAYAASSPGPAAALKAVGGHRAMALGRSGQPSGGLALGVWRLWRGGCQELA
ncbi:MAG: type II toxin-antitoxin system Phd/YefM family antitoxin [Cyanobacteria bacterium K_DeepCast_150m_m2_101]|nr:type II toxin-antitoxin system Phd/YefM family antitoxin [Cyanobacteria bacterium K_DeepCast_150m_m2_101]